MLIGKAKRLLLSLTARGDIVLALLLGVIIFLMVLPMPTPLVDFLIAINVAAAVILLMVGIYISSPLSFSALPSVLLLSTLFRLAISITTTRLILLQADAGDIVYAFGNFVVAGNIVVGIVVFLIITIVQFIVITKGSERVAEVSARFSLDGMPGKQMSIDADLRAGIIDSGEAFQRRTKLEKQSQMYGSMDGAMKFVKGDAIAGLCIIVVNIIGGISIGVLQQGMSIGEALQIYTTLTIGDGLVTQIPALLIAITAGIIVTRVIEADDDNDNLGSSIGKQILAHPNALLISAVASAGFALLPGFPTLIFLFVSVSLAGTGLVLKATARQRLEADALTSALVTTERSDFTDLSLPHCCKQAAANLPFSVWLPAEGDAQPDIKKLNHEFAALRQRVLDELGVSIPGVLIRYTGNVPSHHYKIALYDIPVAHGRWYADSVCVPGAAGLLGLLGIETVSDSRHRDAQTNPWVSTAYLNRVNALNLPLCDIESLIARQVAQLVDKHAAEFVGVQETRALLSALEVEFPDLVKESLALVPIQRITQVFKRLLVEGVSIRNSRAILEAIVVAGQVDKDPVTLTEAVRVQLRRQISHRYSDDRNILPALLLDAATEAMMTTCVRQTPQGGYLALEAEPLAQLLSWLRQAVAKSMPGKAPVIVTSAILRRYLRDLISTEHCVVPVLSFQEMTPEVVLQPLDHIKIEPSRGD